jgi:hypothetical protein
LIGEILAQLLPDGRKLGLVDAFGCLDPADERWHVPAGAETDGAARDNPTAEQIATPPGRGQIP